ncbi:SDR family oxidoreductase [Actinomadura rayongensis]|uniref:SDR family oxidoreductase n=1 Tax=Actinomadura rayongensis TaxID=1429076 RepID=A0A6I4WCQ2_9ACTN|nr:SDR family oxidoreductase [Actinomadura rayongensis]MXQ66903.1 SDR family oxidoreductase [Actinomadura rayongensis]
MSNEVRSRTVRGDGVDLAVFERGAGPAVLLVHGYPDTHQVWDAVAERLAERYRVISYDVRGAGASGRPRRTAAYRFEHLMADMRAVLDAVSPGEPVHLVGHDWGSIQCWEAACTMPERFASYTSISGPSLDHVGHWTRRFHPRASVRQTLHSWYIGFFQSPLLPELAWRSGVAGRLITRLEHGDPDFAATLPHDGAAGVRLYRANIPSRLLRPRDRRTDLPVQIVIPEDDNYVTPALAEAARPFVPNLWIRRVKGRHWIPSARPDLIARLVGEHVEQVRGAEPSRGVRRARVESKPEFAGQLVVVTGAGSGIGRATALAFAERGAEIVAADRDTESAERTARLASLLGPPARAYTVDVSDVAAMEKFAAEIDVPDVLVNNAGIGMSGSFLDHTPEDWERVLGVNLGGVIHGARLFGRRMAERGEGGHIVNLASMAGYTPSRELPAYSTSKAAVLMLSECLRAELADAGVGVSAICPGVVTTAITRTTAFVGLTPDAQDRRRRRITRAYGRRAYPPERVAAQIVRAVRDDRAVVPVTPEARLAYLASRVSPSLLRLAARVRLN